MKKSYRRRGKAVRKITKTGDYTYYVTIPRVILDQLRWRERQKVVVQRKGNQVTIRDWRKRDG
jgi:antitoxin component of MazEF toxin-antitoxin module